MKPIDPQTQMVVERSTFGEVVGAIAADLDTCFVHVKRKTPDGEKQETLHFPAGISIVRRR